MAEKVLVPPPPSERHSFTLQLLHCVPRVVPHVILTIRHAIVATVLCPAQGANVFLIGLQVVKLSVVILCL